jgi:hypothetical protein
MCACTFNRRSTCASVSSAEAGGTNGSLLRTSRSMSGTSFSVATCDHIARAWR